MKNKDYVTFELSQLLKKNGFREPCLSHYTATGTVWRCNDEEDFNSESELKVYSRPTMWQVTKWLREVHGLHISISTVIGGRWTYELQDLWQKSNIDEEYNTRIPERDGYPCIDTYEAALHAGIESALELINNNGNTILR